MSHWTYTVGRRQGWDKQKFDVIERSKRGEPRIQEMMDFQLVKQRHQEMLREAELRRRAKALRATRKWRKGRRSALVWEMKRHAGGLLKLLRTLRNAG